MKVLEQGPGWNMEIRCTGKGNGGGGCGSKLLVERGDIYLNRSYDMLGEYETYHTVRCPVCGVENDIPSNQIPGNICDRSVQSLILGRW